MRHRTERHCANCGELIATPKRAGRRRIYAYCDDCRARVSQRVALQRQWDWAAALVKATAMSVTRSKDGKWSPRIDNVTLRALMTVQDGRCALTGTPLLYPPDQDILRTGSTLNQWADARQLGVADRGCIPVLVRAVTSDDWVPGNIVLVAQFMESACRYCGSVAGVAAMFAGKGPPQVPTSAALLQARPAAERVLQEAYAQKLQEEREDVCMAALGARTPEA